jgi:hypothetical protein
MQTYTSEKTSLNQVAAAFKKIDWRAYSVNLDLGGGKYDLAAGYLIQYNVTNLVYDPYNRTKEHNTRVLVTTALHGGADTVTCNNVLNVIAEKEVRLQVIQQAYDNVKDGGTVYFSVYEGDRSGVGKVTNKGYQMQQPLRWYLDEVKEMFPDAQIKKGMIVAIK